MPIQSINGAACHYEEEGAGPLLVLLHAFPVDSRMWAAQRQALCSRFRVITPDFRGFGQSTNQGPFTIPSLADDVHALMTAIAPGEKFVLGGLSMGGYVAMNYAAKYPGGLRGLILADTRDEADNPAQRANRDRMIEVVKAKGSPSIVEMMLGKMLARTTTANFSALVNTLATMMEACPAKTIEHALAALRDRPDMAQALTRLAVPTLLIVGAADELTPPALAEAMQRRIPNAAYAVIGGAGHLSAMEQPGQFSEAIAAFFGK